MGKKRTIVGFPLVPDLLGDMSLLQGFPETPADFDPNGQWINTYRIMTCHGYREDGNEDIGLLRLSKSSDTDDTFRLQVDQEIVNDEHRLHKYAAEIICRKDLTASPVSWRLSSQFTAPNQSDLRALEETGKAKGMTGALIREGPWIFEPDWWKRGEHRVGLDARWLHLGENTIELVHETADPEGVPAYWISWIDLILKYTIEKETSYGQDT